MASETRTNVPKSGDRRKLVRESLSRQEVLSEFEKMRKEQRQLYAELADQEVELLEHREVIKALRHVNPSEKTFYLMSDVLVERNVRETFPLVLLQKEKIDERIETLNAEIQERARQVHEFQNTYNIRVKADASSEEITTESA